LPAQPGSLDKKLVLRTASVFLLLGLITACGSAPPRAAPPPPAPAPSVPVRKLASPPAGTLYRSDVQALVNRGFPSFLQRVEVEPSLDNGKFKGWAIVALNPPEFWRGVDLKPGDVVVSVNGLPIERETEAFDAFESLRSAERLEVAYVRGGEPRKLVYKIVEAPPR
jgi:S1-C subfamily serine protease